MSAPVVTVTQADREVVTAFHNAQLQRIFMGDRTLGENREAIEQAFARHREQAEAAFCAREAELVEALERAAEVFDWLTENQPDCYGWHAPYPSVEPAIKLEADEIRAILARAKATSEAPHA